MNASCPPTGLLYSQIGYETELPVRVIVRGPGGYLDGEARVRLVREDGSDEVTQTPVHWGHLWGSDWWVAEFPAETGEGAYSVSLCRAGAVLLTGGILRIRRGILFERTAAAMCTDLLDPREALAKAGCGWQDAGAMWQESPSHSAMIIGLCDVLDHAGAKLASEVAARARHHLAHGCEYLLKTQEAAERCGHDRGALSHDLLGHEDAILPQNAMKAVVAWRRAARLLEPENAELARRCRDGAKAALDWLATRARPLGNHGFCHRQRGLPPETVIPGEEWPTRDLLGLCWAGVESHRDGDEAGREIACSAAGQILARQITPEEAEAGYFGHFREFGTLPHSEKAWCHAIKGGCFGADAGGLYAHYLLPIIELLRLFPGHEDADRWRGCLQNFVDGYLLPGCRANPFGIAPYGICGEEGPIWFAGPWHGFNCLYGQTAALAIELATELDEPALVEIAHANLQWVAGLNAGVTADSIRQGSVVYRADIPEGRALPCSLIHGIGNRSAGTWFASRGVVCNGFATGKQFEFDTDPVRNQDGPHSLTDEDWIPHSAAWLSGCSRLWSYRRISEA